MSWATKSMIPSSAASEAGIEALSRTARSAHSASRPRNWASDRAQATVSLTALASVGEGAGDSPSASRSGPAGGVPGSPLI